MGKERASFNLDDETIDIEDLTSPPVQNKPSKQEIQKTDKQAAQLGFVSRQPKKRRKVSPYTEQFGGKCRVGMKPLFQAIGERLDCYDTETLERAILALIEKEGYKDLHAEFEELTK